ncbi:helix-turn-helix transcriptional regulator [Streptomyces sp. TRM S81-3]|uniref:Helix-turn-helix transcriptional regulator n=1 Tax=Streptomyces griseicoloratus TaxID=2752516 RepID=A0A926QS89_9ACTN|nr:helix-turn-helix domain-containing protein [Streptomyces griseicoloratus]MBD0421751.1 helix-turn-helix transcriptional regulator [Streptomyces griseicoloratus]
MRSAGYKHAVFEVVPPSRPSRSRGVSMAGFHDHGPVPKAMRAIPHPAVTLALDFGPGRIVADDATGRRRGSLVAGLAFEDLRVSGRDVEVVQVRLSPVVAYSVLGASPADLQGAVVALDDLWGRDAERILERLSEARSWQDRFALTDDVLARRREAERPGRSVPPEVARAWDRIMRSCGRIQVETLAAEVGWSRKRLWSRFRSHIGLTPHRAAKLVRFHHAAHRLAAGHSPALAAAESGYYDQSHLHRNVQAFTGVTPVTLADEPFLAVDDIAWPGHAPPVTRTDRQ